MPPLVIENPILNSAFASPAKHYTFDDDGNPVGIAEGRRPSSYLIPIAQPKKKTKQPALTGDMVAEQSRENDEINRVRRRVDFWRERGHPDVTPTTRHLLDYWRDPAREKKLYFCQIEALETLIYITEAAKKHGDEWIENALRDAGTAAGTPLFRLACKMATGTGKTVVMAMVIAWHTLNKRANLTDRRFADAFLLVAPNLTIRDRLRVLLPSDPSNAYAELDLVPVESRAALGTAKLVIVNFHNFKQREKGDAGKFTKTVLAKGQKSSAFTESPAEMVRRVCRELGTKKEIVVINDEAHHCYRGRPLAPGEKLTGEDKKEAEAREEEARLWINGLEAVHAKLGVKAVYDLSATPFYLKGSGYAEGVLFPWVVSDFSLMDAIEAGIVKTPRVPTAENAIGNDEPMFRDLWPHIREHLPASSRKSDATAGPPVMPKALQAALHALYSHYEADFKRWEDDPAGKPDGQPPPVFIVVCNNTNVSKMVFDYIGGYETGHTHPDGTPAVTKGELPHFSNVKDARWLDRPNTILVDSTQLESEDGLSPEFKKLAAIQIEEFKAEYRQRFGRGSEDLTDTDVMREVLNTVGKRGKLGEHVRCVVSVSMLTEGWDANTVTHILGVRAFGTALLREQVIGRGLRRVGKAMNEQGHFYPEYADVYGVPFRYLPVAGQPPDPKSKKVQPRPGVVKAEPDRLITRPWLEIAFPRVAAYRYETPPDKLVAKFTKESRLVLSTADLPTKVLSEPIVGESVTMTLADLQRKRMPEVEFEIAKAVARRLVPPDPTAPDRADTAAGLFPQVLAVVRNWIAEYVQLKDHVFPQLLWLSAYRHQAAEKIHNALTAETGGPVKVRAVLQQDDPVGTTAVVTFDTLKRRWTTARDKSHVNYVPYDSDWEAHFAQTLEGMDEVRAYVKNQGLGFRVPYTHEGRPGNYYPDYLVRVDDGHGPDDVLTVVVEVSGQDKEDKQAKADTAAKVWVPAVNALGTFGRWAYVELKDPLSAQSELRKFLKSLKAK